MDWLGWEALADAWEESGRPDEAARARLRSGRVRAGALPVHVGGSTAWARLLREAARELGCLPWNREARVGVTHTGGPAPEPGEGHWQAYSFGPPLAGPEPWGYFLPTSHKMTAERAAAALRAGQFASVGRLPWGACSPVPRGGLLVTLESGADRGPHGVTYYRVLSITMHPECAALGEP
jgi:hypothetical protein